MPEDSSFTGSSVIRAIRMPFVTNQNQSIVLVHLDTQEHEIELLEVKKQSTVKQETVDAVVTSSVTSSSSRKPKKINDWKVTAAEYDELFEYLGAFQVANRVKIKQSSDQSDNTDRSENVTKLNDT